MATARHPKATFFVQRNLFAGLTNFAEASNRELADASAFPGFNKPFAVELLQEIVQVGDLFQQIGGLEG